MLPRSVPKIPEVPASPQYGLAALHLFPRLTRAIFRETTGQQAPPWDKTRRIKRWYDTSVLDGFTGDAKHEVVSYQIFDPAAGRIRRLALTVEEASTPNLPGQYDYPKFIVAPTPAVLVDPVDGSSSPVNPAHLCEYTEALDLARALSATPSHLRENRIGFFHLRWNGETRRAWVLDLAGTSHQVASLLAMRHAHGVNAPGRWDTSQAQPVWIPEIQADTGELDPRPEIPFPVRELHPGEVIEQGFGGIWIVKRNGPTLDTNQLLTEILQISRQTLTEVRELKS